jgi:glutaredoxin
MRPGTAGATRTCPHCKATILESASVCPACRGHLRYDEAAIQREKNKISPLHIEGTLAPPVGDASYEYSMVLAIRNERGEEIARQVIGVGALDPDETRTFTIQVEMTEATGVKAKRRH